MTDTARTYAEIQALFANNSSGQISPQDLRDFVESVANPVSGGGFESGITLPLPRCIFEANNAQWAQGSARHISFDTLYDEVGNDASRVMPEGMGLTYDWEAAEGSDWYTDPSNRNVFIQADEDMVVVLIANVFAANDATAKIHLQFSYDGSFGPPLTLLSPRAGTYTQASMTATLQLLGDHHLGVRMSAADAVTANPYTGVTYATLEVQRLT